MQKDIYRPVGKAALGSEITSEFSTEVGKTCYRMRKISAQLNSSKMQSCMWKNSVYRVFQWKILCMAALMTSLPVSAQVALPR